MTRFAVIRERGPAWDWTRPLREQDAWDEHAAFMDGLVDEGFVLVGGLLGDDGRALHVVEAPNEDAVRARFAEDPWPEDKLRLVSIDAWEVLLGTLPG